MLDLEAFNDYVELNEYVFKTVPWTIKPYVDDTHKLYGKNLEAIEYLVDRFDKKEIGGWCGLNCELFRRLSFEESGEKCKAFNYGLKGSLTHITMLKKFGGDFYLFDPYFNKHYRIDGEPITFKNLMSVVESGNTDVIESVYGSAKKQIEGSDGWYEMTGVELEVSVVDGYMKKGFGEKLIEKFGNDNVFNMMKIEIPI